MAVFLVWDESDPTSPDTKYVCAPHKSEETAVSQAEADIEYGRRVIGVFKDHPFMEQDGVVFIADGHAPVWKPRS